MTTPDWMKTLRNRVRLLPLAMALVFAAGIVVVSPGQRLTKVENRVTVLERARTIDSLRADSISIKLYPLQIRLCVDFEDNTEILAMMRLTQFCRDNYTNRRR